LYFFLHFLTGLCYDGQGRGFDVESYQLVCAQALNTIIPKNQAFSNIKITQYFSQHKTDLLKEKIIQHSLGLSPLNGISNISF